MARLGRLALVTMGAATAWVGACVDLFHSTDFDTLCAVDAAACAPREEGAHADVDAAFELAPDVAAPTLDFCAWSSAEARAHAERACAWMGACQGTLEQSSFGACMIRALAAYDCRFNPSLPPLGQSRARWSCLSSVSSCDEVARCLFGRDVPVCQAVPSGTSFTVCAPDRTSVVECGLPDAKGPPVAVEPCVLEGRTCAAIDTSTSICAGKRGVACSGEPRCDGAHAIECKGTNDVGFDCAAFGSGRCEADDAGVGCAPIDAAPRCTHGAAVECDDAGVARRCLAGKEIAIDCAAIEQPCVEATPSAVDPFTACTNADAGARCAGPDECDGDVLRSCAQGRRFELRCSEVGLGRCVEPPANRGPFVACTRP